MARTDRITRVERELARARLWRVLGFVVVAVAAAVAVGLSLYALAMSP